MARAKPTAVDISRYVEGERGRTDGKESVGAVPATKTGFRPRKPKTQKVLGLHESDLGKLPPTAAVVVNGHSVARIALYSDLSLLWRNRPSLAIESPPPDTPHLRYFRP
jgi:hypothetical protein